MENLPGYQECVRVGSTAYSSRIRFARTVKDCVCELERVAVFAELTPIQADRSR